MTATTRVERDSMGPLEVPADALWGAQTQRAIQNFPPSGLRMPRAFIAALGVHQTCRRRRQPGSWAICLRRSPPQFKMRPLEVAAGEYDDQFPVDVFQTGSGTSSNMNANEVIASLASRALGAASTSKRSSEHESEQQ